MPVTQRACASVSFQSSSPKAPPKLAVRDYALYNYLISPISPSQDPEVQGSRPARGCVPSGVLAVCSASVLPTEGLLSVPLSILASRQSPNIKCGREAALALRDSGFHGSPEALRGHFAEARSARRGAGSGHRSGIMTDPTHGCSPE